MGSGSSVPGRSVAMSKRLPTRASPRAGAGASVAATSQPSRATQLEHSLQSVSGALEKLQQEHDALLLESAGIRTENMALKKSLDDHIHEIDKLRCLAEQHRVSTSSSLSRHSCSTGAIVNMETPTSSQRSTPRSTPPSLTITENDGDPISSGFSKFAMNETPPSLLQQCPTPDGCLRTSLAHQHVDPRCALTPVMEESPSMIKRAADELNDTATFVKPNKKPAETCTGTTLAAHKCDHRLGISAAPLHEEELNMGTWDGALDEASVLSILSALQGNPFTSKFGLQQRTAIAHAMQPMTVAAGEIVIGEGDEGDRLYVTDSGEYELSQGGIVRNKKIGRYQVIGEMAILYKCKRTATITARETGRLWFITQVKFHMVLFKVSSTLQKQRRQFLEELQLFKGLTSEYIEKVAGVATEREYQKGDLILDTIAHPATHFFMLVKGKVQRELASDPTCSATVDHQILASPAYFGEVALLGTEHAKYRAVSPNIVLLEIDKLAFDELIVPLEALGRFATATSVSSIPPSHVCPTDLKSIELHELERVGLLGVGGFGRVELVRTPGGKKLALKMLAKEHVNKNAQEDHVISECEVHAALQSPFCLRLLQTFKDDRFVYFLTPACLGGELWTLLKKLGHFDSTATRYYTGSVVEAIAYLHGLGIVYRDMKPENILLTSTGVPKLADFGFAKRLKASDKTWTFCGTPDYMSPEIVMNQGHGFGADLWSLGVLIFELLVGKPPFYCKDTMATYNRIIIGISAVEFPHHLDEQAKHIVCSLCRPCASERLGNLHDGFAGIRSHPWYADFDWLGLHQQVVVPPPLPPGMSGVSALDGNGTDSFATAEYVGPCAWDEIFG